MEDTLTSERELKKKIVFDAKLEANSKLLREKIKELNDDQFTKEKSINSSIEKKNEESPAESLQRKNYQ
jgi:hypothetical protein